MSRYRFAIFATAACDRPVAVPTARRDAPACTAALMCLSRRSVHSRAFCAADAAAERSGIGVELAAKGVSVVAGGRAAVDVDESTEALLGHPELDLSVAMLAGAFAHVPTVHKVSAVVNKVYA